jgi:hypothetical protein
MTTKANPWDEMLWSSAAPSGEAEEILRRHHRPTIIPATIHPGPGTKLQLHHHLVANGVGKYFSTDEIVEPNDKEKAASVGYDEFVPPAHTWGVVTLLVWLADQMRHQADSPVTMRNLWRPMSYNRIVSTSGIESDHPNACGMDLDFKDAEARRDAQAWLVTHTSETANEMQLSIGFGHTTLHVGVLTPCGTRFWTYDSYKDQVPHTVKVMRAAYGSLGGVRRHS